MSISTRAAPVCREEEGGGQEKMQGDLLGCRLVQGRVIWAAG